MSESTPPHAPPAIGVTGGAPVDAAARQRAIESPRSVLVQAPAGSGKTTLLVQRYLRVLADVEAPERILALTFTRRAAQEMRERVLQALEAATLHECPPTLNPRTWELGVAAQRHLQARGLDVVSHPARLRIETLDAFNAWLAGQLPITAGAGSRLTLTDRPQPLYEEAARRALAHVEDDAFGHAVERVLALDDQRWHSLVKLIAQMLPSRDRWLPLLAGQWQPVHAVDEAQLRRVRRQFDEDLELLVSRALAGVSEAIGGERTMLLSTLMHGAALRLETPSAEMAAWQRDASALRADTHDIARWRAVAGVLLTQEAAYRKQLTKKEGFPPKCADKALLLTLIQELDRDAWVLPALVEIRSLPEPAYDDAQWARVREVAQVLILAAAQLQQVFRDAGVVDFPQVALAALRALGTCDAPTDLSLRLDYRLQHILVDEFQDTSSAQLELLRLLTAGWERGDGRSIFCVGDPMQSIYGFRQAEVRSFLELADDGIGAVRFDVERLRSNFRSNQTLVEWINARFSRILPRIDDAERGAIAFRPSHAALASAEDTDYPVGVRGFSSRREEAAAVAALIAERAATHPQWRIVVLVRARAHARDIAANLRARGLAFRAVDIEPLRDRPVVRDLVMLICALQHRGDRIAWLAVLRAPWLGLTLADLLIVARSGPVICDALSSEAVTSQLSDDGRHRVARARATLDAAFRIRSHGSIARWVEQTWLALGGASCATGSFDLDHVRAVLERLRALEERGLPDAADLAASFDDLYVEHGVPSAVEIMTIHKAKGLEFDLVVVPALDRHVPRNRDQLLLTHQFGRVGRDGMVMAARPGVGLEQDPLFEFLRGQLRDAVALEAQRLLYVACTRAKRELCLTATVGRDEEAQDAQPRAVEAPSWTPRVGSLLAVLWPVAAGDFTVRSQDALAPGAALDLAVLGFVPHGGPLLRVPRGWSAPTLHSPAVGEESSISVLREETPVFDWAGETARRVGTLVHAELQRMESEPPHAQTLPSREAHFCRWLAVHGVPAERLQDATQRVLAALTGVQGDTRAQWILRRRTRDDVREHAVTGRLRGETVRVVFDRSFVDAGVRWVIDYKTSHHGGGNVEEFLDREVLRYTPQLHRYAQLARLWGPEPVRVGLYFPLLRAWREWAP